MAKNKNKSFGRGAQFIVIATVLLILGGVLLFTETPKENSITDIVEDSAPITNVELIGETEIEVVESDAIEEIEEVGFAKEEAAIPGDVSAVVRDYFKKYNEENFAQACDILADSKCNAKNAGDVSRFAQEYKKMTSGYENLNLWAVEAPDFHSNVVCVEYDYTYNSAPSVVLHEVMSFYLQNGKITSRVCESKTADGNTIDCPIISRRDFCL